MKLTDWYNGWQKPVRKGWYECMSLREPHQVQFDYWNGKAWCAFEDEVGYSSGYGPQDQDNWMWRGVEK